MNDKMSWNEVEEWLSKNLGVDDTTITTACNCVIASLSYLSRIDGRIGSSKKSSPEYELLCNSIIENIMTFDEQLGSMRRALKNIERGA